MALKEAELTEPRGFARMTPERRREVSAMGGRSLRTGQRGFARNPELARAAGIKGGKNVAPVSGVAEKREVARIRSGNDDLSRLLE